MSYDVRVWSVAPCRDSESRQARGRDWLLNVSDSEPVLSEDVPDAIGPLLPGIAFVTTLTLEGNLGRAGVTALHRAAKEIALAVHGAIEDPQEQQVGLPSGVKRWSKLVGETETESATQLELNWWTDQPVLLERAKLNALLDVLASHLPEALPRRYGEFEPPAHRFEESGRDHLVDFLLDRMDRLVVWLPTAPVNALSIATHRGPLWVEHAGAVRFRAHRLTISIDNDTLQQPGWDEGLRRAWRAISAVLRPFYGDVRTTSGHKRSRNGRWWTTANTEKHPVRSWWWGGIPARLGCAAVLGPPYLEKWPRFAERATILAGLAFVSASDWRDRRDVGELVGGVPSHLALLPYTDFPADYPATFPFPRGRP